MPFTISHVVAVLPLATGRSGQVLVPAALAIGAMVPDLPYFVGPLSTFGSGQFGSSWSHSAWGPVTSDLLMGLAVFALWHVVVARPLADLSPRGLRVRLPPRRSLTPTAWLWAACSVVIGATTHVVWDTFSHRDRWGTRHVGLLTDLWGPLPLFKWFQYGSGVFGLLGLMWWLWRWWSRATPNTTMPALASRRSRIACWVVAGLVGAATVTLTWVSGAERVGEWLDEGVAVQIATRTITTTATAVLGLCLFWWGRLRNAEASVRKTTGSC